MRWRSLRQLNLHVRHPRPSFSTGVARRHLSKHATLNNSNNNNNNIASILALSPIADGFAQRKVEVTAHIRTIRNQKRHSFVELGDGSTIHSLQAVLSPSQATRYVYASKQVLDVSKEGLFLGNIASAQVLQ